MTFKNKIPNSERKQVIYIDKQKISYIEKKYCLKKEAYINKFQFNSFSVTLVHATLPCQKQWIRTVDSSQIARAARIIQLITVKLKTHNNGYKDKSIISAFGHRSDKNA